MLHNDIKILLVDDCIFTAKTLSIFLKGKGYDLHHVLNASNALENINQHNYQAIFTDIELPDMLGIELITEFIKIEKLKETKIIALTGRINNTKDYYLELGFDEFILKPCSLETILNTIQ